MEKKEKIMVEYIFLVHDLFEKELFKYKEDKRGLGKNFSLAIECHWNAIGEANRVVATKKRFYPLIGHVNFYNRNLHSHLLEQLKENKNPLFPASQFNYVIDRHWRAAILSCIECAKSGFREPGRGRPRHVVNS